MWIASLTVRNSRSSILKWTICTIWTSRVWRIYAQTWTSIIKSLKFLSELSVSSKSTLRPSRHMLSPLIYTWSRPFPSKSPQSHSMSASEPPWKSNTPSSATTSRSSWRRWKKTTRTAVTPSSKGSALSIAKTHTICPKTTSTRQNSAWKAVQPRVQLVEMNPRAVRGTIIEKTVKGPVLRLSASL